MVVASWSGGKDSALMLETLLADPAIRVVSLLTTVTTGYDRISIHGVRRAILDAQVSALGWKGLYPIWGLGTHELAQSFIARSHLAILTCVDTTQLDPAFAGRAYDEALLRDLPPLVDPCGENGEFHSCLVGGPLLGGAIPVQRGARVLREGRFEYCDLIPT